MSKTIIIQKNGVAQTLTVDKLRLPDAAGGTENWLPADGKNLVNLEVKQNGTYRASDFSAYGIAEVKVKCTLNGGAATPKATEKLLNALHHPAPAEGGRARTMSAHHLETPQDGGGTVPWVPEEEVALGTKSVNVDNRTYKASDDGKYGYSEFTVSGISITKDGDTITHTDGTGTKTYTLPHHIRVEHGPLKFTYNVGETIDYYGMLVKAYNADGTVWIDENYPDGVIPLEELILPATAGESGGIYGFHTLDGTINAIRAVADGELIPDRWYQGHPIGERAYRCSPLPNLALYPKNSTIYLTRYNDVVYCAGYSGLVGFTTDDSGQSSAGVWGSVTSDNTFVVFSSPSNIHNSEKIPVSLANPTGIGVDQLVGDFEDILVQWPRPYDGEILKDYFTIVLNPPEGTGEGYGGAEGGGGQTSGGGAGRDN